MLLLDVTSGDILPFCLLLVSKIQLIYLDKESIVTRRDSDVIIEHNSNRVNYSQPLDVSCGVPHFGVLKLSALESYRTPLTVMLLF